MSDVPALDPGIGYVIAVACALGYLDLRSGRGWRDTYPALSAWVDHFAATVPAFNETIPVG